MADYQTDLNGLEAQFLGLEGSLSGAETVAGAFRQELDSIQGSMKDAGRETSNLSKSVSSSLRDAFEGVAFGGEKLSSALGGIGKSISGSVFDQAIAPVQKSMGSMLTSGLQSMFGGLFGFAKGAAFSSGRVAAFAQGGIVDRATNFPMRNGTGLMGEAGPEAIIPLARGADGRLGVRGGGGGNTVHVTMNITSPDVRGFRRSQSQIAAEMSRAMQVGKRNL